MDRLAPQKRNRRRDPSRARTAPGGACGGLIPRPGSLRGGTSDGRRVGADDGEAAARLDAHRLREAPRRQLHARLRARQRAALSWAALASASPTEDYRPTGDSAARRPSCVQASSYCASLRHSPPGAFPWASRARPIDSPPNRRWSCTHDRHRLHAPRDRAACRRAAAFVTARLPVDLGQTDRAKTALALRESWVRRSVASADTGDPRIPSPFTERMPDGTPETLHANTAGTPGRAQWMLQ